MMECCPQPAVCRNSPQACRACDVPPPRSRTEAARAYPCPPMAHRAASCMQQQARGIDASWVCVFGANTQTKRGKGRSGGQEYLLSVFLTNNHRHHLPPPPPLSLDRSLQQRSASFLYTEPPSFLQNNSTPQLGNSVFLMNLVSGRSFISVGCKEMGPEMPERSKREVSSSQTRRAVAGLYPSFPARS